MVMLKTFLLLLTSGLHVVNLSAGTATFTCISGDLTFNSNHTDAVGHVSSGDPLCYWYAPHTPQDYLAFTVAHVGAIAGSGSMWLDGIGGSLGMGVGQPFSIGGYFPLAIDGTTDGTLSIAMVSAMTPLTTSQYSKPLSGTYTRLSLPTGYQIEFVFNVDSDSANKPTIHNPEPATFGFGLISIMLILVGVNKKMKL